MIMTNTSLTDAEIEQICAALRTAKNLERAVLFGSRAMGLARYNSDVDLMLYGDALIADDVAQISAHLDESTLPYMFDLIVYDENNHELNKHVQQFGKLIYTRDGGWNRVRAVDFIDFNPRESMAKGTMVRKVGMEHLLPFARDILTSEVAPFNGGAKFRNGDTLMARITPCLENGKTAQVNILEDDEVGFGSTEFIVLRAKPNVSNKDFIYYLAISPLLRDKAIKSMVGSSGRQRVQQGVLDNTVFLAPPLAEQMEIGRILSCLDDKIELNNLISKNLEAQAQAIFKSWFVDFEPWGGEQPVNWTIGTVSNISADVVCGKTPSTKIAEYFGEDVPFITIPDMHDIVYITSTDRSLSKAGVASQSSKTVPSNSVCVSCIATAGLVVLTSVPSQTNQQINTIVCKDGISPYFVYLTMVGMADHIKMLGSSGSATNNLNKGQFSKIEMVIPESDDMSEFSALVEPLFVAIKRYQQENALLVETRDTLLPRLMSGEIPVGATIHGRPQAAGRPPNRDK